MPPKIPSPAGSQRQLWLAGNWAEMWRAVVLPWLREQAAQAWRDRRPTVVLVPSRATGFHVHERVVQAGFNLAAIHFWTPSDARMNLQKFFPGVRPTPSREMLHLFATLAAEEVLQRDPDNRTAAAIAVEPSAFIQTVDQLAGAGWDLSDVAEAPLRAVVKQWRTLLQRHGFQTVQEIDRALIAQAGAAAPKIAKVIVAGFDGAHWPEWPLLQAVVETAQSATVALVSPKLGWEEMDQAWIGTWEERFGAAQPCEDASDEILLQPYLPLQSALHAHEVRTQTKSAPVSFYLGRNVRGEAEAIVATALEMAQSADCTRLGIVFPGICPLAREVAALLEKVALPCDDAFGFTQPGSFERADWRAWRDWQESPGLARLLALLEFVPMSVLLPEEFQGASRMISRADIEFALRDAFKEVLLDDVTVLRAWLAPSTRTRDKAAVACLDALLPLPERATWKVMTDAVLAMHRRLGWGERAEQLTLALRRAEYLNEETVSRAAFLRWLGEVAVSTQKQRGAESNHRYGRIHLLNYNEAEKQQWSHLILTSLSEGIWPPSGSDSGFLRRNEVVKLNRSVRRLNVTATQQGSQGEGHVSLEPGKGLCLGPLERRLLAESQSLGILENVSVSLVVTARLGEEKSSGQVLAPGEFLSRLYALQTGKVLDDAATEELCSASEKRAREVLDGLASASVAAVDITSTARAYAARRDTAQSFGEFDFSLRAPLAIMPTLSCGEWESALKEPAAMWLRKFLRVQPVEEASVENVLLPVRGTWTHRWLSKVGVPRSKQFLPWPTLEEVLGRQEQQAVEQRDQVEKILQQCGRSLPVWWVSLWREARFQVRELTAVLAPAREWPAFATEYELPETECDFSEGALPPLRLKGRIDLLLAWTLPTDESLPPELWLVDFKTGGASRAMTVSELSKGNGVQLALYALALRQLGATAVQASLLRPGEMLREQMSLEKFDGFRDAWQELQRMQASGGFGVHGELRSEYRHAKAYPLATLAIDPDVLEEKWARSHPAWSDVV